MKLQLIDKKTLNIHWYERVENWEWRNRWVNESKDSYGNWVYRWDYMRRQYTWIKDKNWVEIYEGDIVEWDDWSNGKWRRRCEILWVKSKFELHGYYYDIENPTIKFKFWSFIYEYDWALEVIWNIYQNPDLLEK